MEDIEGKLIVSPSDLVGHLACGHLTSLNLEAATTEPGPEPREQADDPAVDVVRRRGDEHEQARLAQLRATRWVTEIDAPDPGLGRIEGLLGREQETVDAMASGVDVVFQATFLDERGEVLWRGHADFVHRVDAASQLGDHAYEPEDVKLARSVKASAVLQLCAYADQVERIQGVAPDRIHVALGDGRIESIRLAEVSAYYRAARDRFLADLVEAPETYPLPVGHCAVCEWADHCAQRRIVDDHLCLVAGLGREQARRLEAGGVPTLTALAELPAGHRVTGVGSTTVERLRRQAALQARRVEGEPPPFALDPAAEEGLGLDALPTPDAGDLFYDIEGDPFVGVDGIEYLHGLGWLDEDGAFAFEAFWAHNPGDEQRAFEDLIDRIVERLRSHPGLHVYHYAPYERTALGRLMGRYGTREDEVDELLRGEVFVDLYRVVRQGLVIGSPSYSLKALEPRYMEAREGAITDAGSSIVSYEEWLDTRDDQILDDIEAYNRDDVESLQLLRDWLAEVRDGRVSPDVDLGATARTEAGAGNVEGDEDQVTGAGHAAEAAEPTGTEAGPTDQGGTSTATEPKTDAGGDDEEHLIQDLMRQLLDGEEEPPGPDAEAEARARWLMAHLLCWHRREDKPEWWKYFDRVRNADELDLYEDTEAIAGLNQVGDPGEVRRSYIWTYEFDPDQEHKLSEGTTVEDPATKRRAMEGGPSATTPGWIYSLDSMAGRLQLSRGKGSDAPHPTAVIPQGPIKTDAQRASLQRLASAMLYHGVDGEGPGRAARQLLGRRPPTITGATPGRSLRHDGEATVDAAVRLVSGLHGSYLAIQGPPGSGKTYTAAKVIVALVAQGKQVGITANSHAVIGHVLTEALKEAENQGVTVRVMQKHGDDGGVDHPAVQRVRSDNDAVEQAVAEGEVDVVAGTAWLFSRPGLQASLDTLVVDEAGQLSLANVAAVAPSARNLVLVGDPRQLAQPSKGTHPEGAGASALEHVLAGAATVGDDQGLFLDHTWRLPPGITAFISEQVYEGRLQSQNDCARQTVAQGPVVAGAGLRWSPVVHEGNATSSPEEAAEVARVHGALLGRSWTDGHGTTSTIDVDDILVVAPYNAQVRELTEALPEGSRVGTVDRFQGQEAAAVIVSLAASSAQDVPRGMEFLYSRNRLNVAVSRAKALTVMVASPTLLSVRCHSVAQMKLANVLCRYVEMATPVEPPSRQ